MPITSAEKKARQRAKWRKAKLCGRCGGKKPCIPCRQYLTQAKRRERARKGSTAMKFVNSRGIEYSFDGNLHCGSRRGGRFCIVGPGHYGTHWDSEHEWHRVTCDHGKPCFCLEPWVQGLDASKKGV